MHPLLKRILVNGLVAASLLAVMGYGLTELARLWLVAQAPARAQPGAPSVAGGDIGDAFGARVPLTMAGWGVGFVVVAELFRWFVLRRREPVTKGPPPPPGPDPAEVLLEQLLSEAEAKQAAADTASSPSPTQAENTRT
ncbi:MAG TPA: hypothetical protein VH092_15530 [Urbifossiella sp.]|jgi:hypothetical protein|nr:hypothetical protein [Urbifossiella sp.]